MAMNTRLKNTIISKLEDAGAISACHRCGDSSYQLLEGFSKIHLEEDVTTDGMTMGKPSAICAHIACSKCGALTAHELGPLGMLPKE